MIKRHALPYLQQALQWSPAVALLGPRQVGKTTLAMAIAQQQPAVYLDMENPRDHAKARDIELFHQTNHDKLIIIDEIQRLPELFATLRGLIDKERRLGKKAGCFLLLGSASMELLKQSSESLAGRIQYIELSPLQALEVQPLEPPRRLSTLWNRGGFPDSYQADNDAQSLRWRSHFIRTYLERDIPQLGPRIPAETLRRCWTMLAHQQAATLNVANLAQGLGISGQTVARYVDLLVDLLLLRRLQPWVSNVGKRLVKAPKVYVRDSGIAHALLGIATYDELLGHPVVGGSWEGFVIENLLSVVPPDTQAFFYRSPGGAEIDLLLQLKPGRVWAIEIKHSMAPTLTKGFYTAQADIAPEKSFVVYPGTETYHMTGSDKQSVCEVIGLEGLMRRLLEA